MARRSGNSNTNSSANLGFEAKLWLAADKLRSNMGRGGIQAPGELRMLKSEVRNELR